MSAFKASKSYPPHRHHFCKQVSPTDTLSLLSSYLAKAATDASLHPNALLTENGPVTPATGAHSLGLVLNNLQRIEAGLSGEFLGFGSTLAKRGGEGLPNTVGVDGLLRKLASDDMEDPCTAAQSSGDGEVQWQDKTEFDREQEITQGEIEQRSNAVDDAGDGQRVPNVEATKSTADREERKRRKKQKRLQERKDVEARRRRKSAKTRTLAKQ